jgi:dephospho-CoA kinase
VGLVGGIGSGKSTLARLAAARYGFAHLDGDVAGHRALAEPDVQARLRDRFSPGVFKSDGTVDRSALAKLVFGDTPAHAKAKSDLEAITHPVIRREFEHRIAEAGDAGAPAVLLDAAVLLETGWRGLCDAVLFVDAPEELRKARVAARGWTPAEWRRREASQMPLAEKRLRSDALIDNSGPADTAADELARAIERLCHLRLRDPAALAAAPA